MMDVGQPQLPQGLGKRYTPLHVLGLGDAGMVWLAKDRSLDRQVVIKLTTWPRETLAAPLSQARQESCARTVREGQVLASLRHPNVIQVHEAGELETGPYLVVEYLPGGTVEEHRLDLDLTRVFLEVGQGLAAVHSAGLVHRNLTPSNLLLAADGRAVLADFALVGAPDRATLTETGQLVGTMAFQAPEVLSGGLATKESDWYSWGASLYASVVGRPPFSNEDLMVQIADGAPLSLDLTRVPDGPLRRALLGTLVADPQARRPPLAALGDDSSGPEAEVPQDQKTYPPPSLPRRARPEVTVQALAPAPRTSTVPPPRSLPAPETRSNGWLVAAALFAAVGLGVGFPEPGLSPGTLAHTPSEAEISARSRLDAAHLALARALPKLDLADPRVPSPADLGSTYRELISPRTSDRIAESLDTGFAWLRARPKGPRADSDPTLRSRVRTPAARWARCYRLLGRLLQHSDDLSQGHDPPLPPYSAALPGWDPTPTRIRVDDVRRHAQAFLCRADELGVEERPELLGVVTDLASTLNLLDRDRRVTPEECLASARTRAPRYAAALRAQLTATQANARSLPWIRLALELLERSRALPGLLLSDRLKTYLVTAEVLRDLPDADGRDAADLRDVMHQGLDEELTVLGALPAPEQSAVEALVVSLRAHRTGDVPPPEDRPRTSRPPPPASGMAGPPLALFFLAASLFGTAMWWRSGSSSARDAALLPQQTSVAAGSPTARPAAASPPVPVAAPTPEDSPRSAASPTPGALPAPVVSRPTPLATIDPDRFADLPGWLRGAVRTTLPARYKDVVLVAVGGMGAVLKARDDRLKRVVAIKLTAPHLASSREIRERFQREAQAMALLNHPNIATVHDIPETPPDEAPLLVMEYLEGQDLSEVLKQGGPVSSVLVRDWVRQIGAALEHAHNLAVLHRDVKPGNIFRLTSGTLKLVDFGLAAIRDRSQITKTGARMGSVRYMPPEQLRGDRVGPAADQYALAVTAYQLLTNEFPFAYEDPARTTVPDIRDSKPEVPSNSAAALRRAMSPEDTARFPSVAAFVAAFCAVD